MEESSFPEFIQDIHDICNDRQEQSVGDIVNKTVSQLKSVTRKGIKNKLYRRNLSFKKIICYCKKLSRHQLLFEEMGSDVYTVRHRLAALTLTIIVLCMVTYLIGSQINDAAGNVNSGVATQYNIGNNLQWSNKSLAFISRHLSLRDQLNSDELTNYVRKSDFSYDENLLKLVKENKFEQSVILFLLQPTVNQHEFRYIQNPQNTCNIFQPQVLITVPSAPSNFEKRQNVRNSIRELLANNRSSNNILLMFFIGRASNEVNQQKIDLESAEHGDIVQETFKDTYRNIRYKAVSMLKWANMFCQSALYVIRTDDDVKVDIPPMIERLKSTKSQYDNFILGHVLYNDDPARNPRSKWHLPYSEFPGKKLPPYALGGALGYPMLTVRLLYQAALRVPPVWLDDLYITGICAPRIGAKLFNDSAFRFKHFTPTHFI
ncbi:hypothetical protein Btru_042494 [Bulinus truncatus]|nr:hypothetical protein Btru_042494 [Bulinus truncatus]